MEPLSTAHQDGNDNSRQHPRRFLEIIPQVFTWTLSPLSYMIDKEEEGRYILFNISKNIIGLKLSLKKTAIWP